MAWLQSSFTNHQAVEESVGSSHRKGYKGGSSNKNAESDKSDTPLLQDSPCLSPEKEKDDSDWFGNIGSATSKKQYVPAKSNFLSSSFFEKSSINSVLKPLTGSRETSPNPSGLSSKSKLKKDCKLMKAEMSKREPESEEYEDDEDDWCVFHYAGGYQKVKSGAD